MAKKEKLTPDQVIEALKAHNGMAYLAADQLNVCVRTVYNYATRYKQVAQVIEHQKGKRLDTAESALWKAILNGEAWAICFLLKTQGKDRGYTEKQLVEHSSTNRLVIEEEVVSAEGRAKDSASPGAT